MLGKLRNMTSVYLTRGSKILLLYREGSRVANHVWIGSAGGHFEPQDQNDARACVLRELYEEMGITERQISHLALRYITLKRNGDEILRCRFLPMKAFFGGLRQKSCVLFPCLLLLTMSCSIGWKPGGAAITYMEGSQMEGRWCLRRYRIFNPLSPRS